MEVYAVHCKNCNCIIFSRSRHDHRSCKCKSTSIDGGKDYHKLSIIPGTDTDRYALDLSVEYKQLYADWNYGIDKYGLIEFDKLKDTEYINSYTKK